MAVVHQCALLDLPRSTFYHAPQAVSDAELTLMQQIDRCHRKYPFCGSRRIRDWLEDHGLVYLVAIMDWHSRKVLAWRILNTLGAIFCVDALEDAIEQHGTPQIFIPTRAVSSPARPSQKCSRKTAFASVWTVEAVGWTTFLLNDSGAL